MNIGIVTTWFERGAAYVSRQYKQVLAREHKVFIYARGGEAYAIGDPIWDGPDVTWAKRVPYGNATAIDLSDFRRWLLDKAIDLVLFNEQMSWPPVLLCNELGCITGAYVDYYTEETIPFFACYDFLVCNTRRHHSAFDWHPQAWYIPWGTDVDLFKPAAPDERGALRFFHSCGVSPERKGTDLVLQAFAGLTASTAVPIHLTIHAQRPLETKLPDLAPTIAQLTAEQRLTVITATVPAPGLYHLGDVYVYPTRLEGIGLTIAEALACGLPVITTDQPPMNEFVQHGVNGRLVTVERHFARADGYYWPQSLASVASLRDALAFYIEHVAALAQFQEQARQYAVERLDWSANAAPLLDRLRDVQKRPGYETMSAAQQALAFERRQLGLRQRYPRLYTLAMLAARPYRWLRTTLKSPR